MPSDSEYRRFDVASLADLDDALERDGVAVVKGAVSPEDVLRYREGVFRGLGQLTSKMPRPVRADDPQSWKTLFELGVSHSMLIKHWGVGHMPVAWDIRQNLGVIEPFSAVNGGARPEDLLVSFDGLSVHFPPEVTGRGWYRKPWFHTDQASVKVGRHCVQGLVNLYDVREGDATLRVLRGSHESHAAYFRDAGVTCRADWHKLDGDAGIPPSLSRHEPACVVCDAGDLVLWDSRTFHHGVQPTRGRARPATRMAVYVCYTPRDRARPAALKRKREHFEGRRTTSHWPHEPRAVSKTPQLYGKPAPDVGELGEPAITGLGQRLAGL